VSATFGVSPDAILAASAVEQPPLLTPSEVIVIPGPDQSPEEAAIMAAERDGTSPFVVDAYFLAEGDTLAAVAAWHEMPVEALATFNGIADPEQLTAGQRLLIPAADAQASTPPVTAPDEISIAGPTDEDLAAFTSGAEQVIEVAQPAELVRAAEPSLIASEVTVPGVPAYHQAYNLSSGYAAAYIATSAFGAGVPESVFVDSVPLSQNPHWGYRGNLNGDWGGTTDYGVYAEPLVPVLNSNGFNAEVLYGAGDPAVLRAYLDAGSPVIAWLGLSGDTAYAVEDDGSYLLAPGMHVVVVYGYDDGGVYLADPASGDYDYYAWADFLAMWSTLNGMGLAVAPW
jgi:LysM repeat protein